MSDKDYRNQIEAVRSDLERITSSSKPSHEQLRNALAPIFDRLRQQGINLSLDGFSEWPFEKNCFFVRSIRAGLQLLILYLWDEHCWTVRVILSDEVSTKYEWEMLLEGAELQIEVFEKEVTYTATSPQDADWSTYGSFMGHLSPDEELGWWDPNVKEEKFFLLLDIMVEFFLAA